MTLSVEIQPVQLNSVALEVTDSNFTVELNLAPIGVKGDIGEVNPITIANAVASSASATNAANSATASATSATAAAGSATAAATQATNSANSAATATTQATNATNSATTATTQAGIATTKATAASGSATAAATSATNSATSATNSANSATAAAGSATSASSSANSTAALLASFRGAFLGSFASDSAAATFASANSIALNNGIMYENNSVSPEKFRIYNGTAWQDYDATAQASQSAAALSAANAASSASNAASSATTATTQATNAAASATSASGSASTATTQATNASNSATAAAGSATTATTQATNAANSATASAGSASAAAGSASTATTQAGIATTKESSATTSATNAATSATNAANSATSASGSASTATTQAGIATTQATNAAASATSASGSASTATTQAGNASTSATNSANSATAAAGSATTASTQATNAGNSATAAATSATNASNSATAAAASAASINPSNVAITGGNINGVAIGATTPATGKFTTLTSTGETNAGSYTFTGTGNRITGDFSNATIASRVAFQTSTVNGTTTLTLAPNGTSVNSNFSAESDPLLVNSSFAQLAILGGSDARITSSIRGTGTYLPLTMYTGGSERMRIDTGGLVGIGTSTPSGKLDVTGGDVVFKSASEQFVFIKRTDTAVANNYIGDIRFDGLNSSSANIPYAKFNTQMTGITAGSEAAYVSLQAVRSGSLSNFLTYDGLNNVLASYTSGLERMRIDSAGNVGIGTTTPNFGGNTVALAVNGSSTSALNLKVADVGAFTASSGSGYTAIADSRASVNMQFVVGASERMRIDTSGRLLVGTTAASGSNLLQVSTDALIHGITVGLGGGSQSLGTVFGYQSLSNNTTGTNLSIGYQAMSTNTTGDANTAVGRFKPLFANTTGSNNVAIGDQAMLSNTTGSLNTAIGTQALVSNTTASNNTAVGYQAGYSNTTGYENTYIGTTSGYGSTIGVQNSAVGKDVLYANTSGSCNAGLGYAALRLNTTGGNNTALGYESLFNNTTASNNTAVGYQAGYSNTTGTSNTYLGYIAGTSATGSGNTFIGFSAGNGATSGAYNTSLGYAAGNNLTTGTGCVYIGVNPYNGASGAASNEIVICSVSIGGKGTNTGFISPNGGAMYQGNNSTLWSITSDQRIKENIVTLENGLSTIIALRPVEFDYIETKKHDISFIAQEYQKVLPNQVSEHAASLAEKEITGVDTLLGLTPNLIPYLVAAIQELNAKVTALELQLGAK